MKSFFAKYPEEELACRLEGGFALVRLFSLDVQEFQKKVSLFPRGSDSAFAAALLESISRKILSLGSFGLKDGKRLFAGYDRERKVKGRKAKELGRGRHYYAKGGDFSRENADLPPEYRNKVVCGDSLEVLKKLPGNCVDLVLTSPPYNFGLEYGSDDDARGWENYFEKLFEIFGECLRVLKYGGRIAVNIQPLFSDYIPSHHLISNYFMSKKMIWKGEILWEKNNYNCKYTAWGSWRSPSNPYLKYTWEFIELFSKGDLKKSGRREDADLTAEEFKKWVVSRWSIAPERRMKDFDHPAMFPEELAARVIKLFSFRNDVVLDPFNGVGTTTAVAARLGRRYLGIDVSREYCRKARKRTASAEP